MAPAGSISKEGVVITSFARGQDSHGGQIIGARASHHAKEFLKPEIERKRMKDGKLKGKVAVVTGASKGIGAGIAKEFAAEGAAVVVNYASSKTDADKVVDEITKRGGKAIAVQGNVAKKKEVEQLFGAAKKAFGKID